ncbi:MAG: hypothetical protein COT84_02825 [Chlamydiae bacterium CG10_big_fil_rev_8_21_14_0_10_35_9]|nr:MAG: hypothetical protein COT84_02825 [Chlamydiae bacterium CG10_big_fil_rev_8_21_14_0_10_35_9]
MTSISAIKSDNCYINFKPIQLFSALCQKISNIYFRVILSFVNFLENHNQYVAAMVTGTLLTEPVSALKAALLYPLGWKKNFNFIGMNPKSITKEQSEKRPILLLHGNLHNQSAWISFAKKLRKENLGPVYTLNLPNHSFSSADKTLVEEKITEILKQYRKWNNQNVKIDVIGHSRGATVATCVGLKEDTWLFKEGCPSFYLSEVEKRAEIGKVIKIGYPTTQWYIDNVQITNHLYEIYGTRDVLAPKSSNLSQKFEVNTGHLGLLYSSSVHNKAIEWLKDTTTN